MKYAFIHFSFLLHFLIHMCMVTDIQHGSLVGFECKFKSFERKFEPFKCKFEPFEWKFEEFKCKFEPFKRKFEPFECKFYLSNGNSNHSNGNSQPSLFHSYYHLQTPPTYIKIKGAYFAWLVSQLCFLQILDTGIWSCKIAFWKSAAISRDYWLFHYHFQTGGTIGILQRHLNCTHEGNI